MAAPTGVTSTQWIFQEATRGTAPTTGAEGIPTVSADPDRDNNLVQPQFHDGRVSEHAPIATVTSVDGSIVTEGVYDTLSGTTPIGIEMLIAMLCGDSFRSGDFNLYGFRADPSVLSSTLQSFTYGEEISGDSVRQTRGCSISSLTFSVSRANPIMSVTAAIIGHSQSEDTFANFGQVIDVPTALTHITFDHLNFRLLDHAALTPGGSGLATLATADIDISAVDITITRAQTQDFGIGANSLLPLIGGRLTAQITISIPRASASQFDTLHDTNDPEWLTTQRDANAPLLCEAEFINPSDATQVLYFGFPDVRVMPLTPAQVQGDAVMPIQATLAAKVNPSPYNDQTVWYDENHNGLDASAVLVDSTLNMTVTMNSSITTMTVNADASAILFVGDIIEVETELMLVTSVVTTTIGVARGIQGTTAAGHTATLDVNKLEAPFLSGATSAGEDGLGLVTEAFVISTNNARTAPVLFS